MKQVIQAMVQNILCHWGLTDYVPGRVASVTPLRVSLDDRLLLEAENLILTAELSDVAQGDALILLRVLRGQKYIVLAKAVGA